ncbi:unnamed protein product [Allacma fusca]|uniref:Uncharacterized protein n=1 Tax=Allacma fusca TaxID=39272 RepID=A0A8J2KBF8_9HEXA|nr:unnamed protein product [Allacma fusca]
MYRLDKQETCPFPINSQRRIDYIRRHRRHYYSSSTQERDTGGGWWGKRSYFHSLHPVYPVPVHQLGSPQLCPHRNTFLHYDLIHQPTTSAQRVQ